MADHSRIPYVDATWNPISGCRPKRGSPGCAHCYAKRDFARYFPDRDFSEIRLHPERFDIPRHWRRPREIFVCSVSDLLHPANPTAFILRIFDTMAACSQHTFLTCTKYPERYASLLYGDEGGHHFAPGQFLPNVRLGTTAENQDLADERLRHLLHCGWNGPTWVSVEPMLGDITLRPYLVHPFNREPTCPWCETCIPTRGTSDWWKHTRTDSHGPFLSHVVVGGESGDDARPTHLDWPSNLLAQAADSGTPFFFTQWGEWAPERVLGVKIFTDTDGRHPTCASLDGISRPLPLGTPLHRWPDGSWSCRVGRHAAGHSLHGKEWRQKPLTPTSQHLLPFSGSAPRPS